MAEPRQKVDLWIDGANVGVANPLPINWGNLLSHLIESYGKANQDTSTILNAVNEACGQAFTSPIALLRLTDVSFHLQRNAAFAVAGNILQARLYRVLAGTVVGVDAVPDIAGGVLATSDNVLGTEPSLGLTIELVNFHFTTPYTLEPQQDYVIVIWLSASVAGQVEVGIDSSTPTHAGNFCVSLTPPAWAASATQDCIFYLFSFSDVLAGGAVDVIDRPTRQVGKVQLTDFTDDGEVYPDGSIPVAPAKVLLAGFDSLAGVSLEGSTLNLALNTDHRGQGTNSVEWDKVAGGVLGGVSFVPPAALDLSVYSTHAKVMCFMYVPTPVGGTITNLYIALGTDAGNLFYWEIPLADIQYDQWHHYHRLMSEVDGVIGVGANLSAVTYVAIYVITSAAGTTLTNFLVDEAVVKRSFVMMINQEEGKPLETEEASPTSIIHGQVTMGGAAQQFPANACKSVTIENDSDRTLGNAVVYVGNDNTVVAGTGYALRPGCTVSYDIDNTDRIWCIGTLNDIITYVGVN